MRRAGLLLAALLILLPLSLSSWSQSNGDDVARPQEERRQTQEELNGSAREYVDALHAVEATRADIERTQGNLRAAKAAYAEVKVVVQRRVVAAYKGEPSSQLVALLSSDSFDELVQRAVYVGEATSRDRAVVSQLAATVDDLDQRSAELSRLEAQASESVVRAAARQKEMESKLEAARAKEGTAANRRAAEDEARRRAAEEAKARQAEAEARARAAVQTATEAPPPTVTTLPEPAPTEPPPGATVAPSPRNTTVPTSRPPPSSGASIVCPVAGPVAFTDDFGEPRSGHAHQGIDLFASRGTPVVAARAGTASRDSGGGGGNMIFLYSGSDYYLYAHLDSYSVPDGASVAQGQEIGAVGNTGDATAYHLHFESHPGGGAAVDPYPQLSRAC